MKKFFILMMCFSFLFAISGKAVATQEFHNVAIMDDDDTPHYQDTDPNDDYVGPDDVDDGSGWYDDNSDNGGGASGVLFCDDNHDHDGDCGDDGHNDDHDCGDNCGH